MPEVAQARLSTQRLVGEPFATPVEAVGRLLAVQSQDYAGAKWALGLRTPTTEAELDRLFDAGAILRTHVLRPTWHFVLPADIGWLLELTAPRVKAQLASFDRRAGVDAEMLRGSRRALEAALADGQPRTRAELSKALGVAGQAAGHLLMHGELEGLLVSGPRQGLQHTHRLLDAPARRLSREEALAELTLRYFTGHGPAQVQDCAWWSGLTIADIRRGLDLVGTALVAEDIGGKRYWQAPDAPAARVPPHTVHLLPNYDEYVVAYRDRSAALDPARGVDLAPFPMGSILAHTVLLDGQVWGGWKRRQAGREVVVELGALDVMGPEDSAALQGAAERLGRFLQRPVRLST
ncbi:MAG TPA: winged helix DNA-binding domain-containing protein [Candidatus Dormibacteraeota bacterium]